MFGMTNPEVALFMMGIFLIYNDDDDMSTLSSGSDDSTSLIILRLAAHVTRSHASTIRSFSSVTSSRAM